MLRQIIDEFSVGLDPAGISDWLFGCTLAACLIAIIAMLVERWGQRPALAHRLWLLAILKLMLPPIFAVPVTVAAPASPLALSSLPLNRLAASFEVSHLQQVDIGSLLITTWMVGSVLLAIWVYRSAARVRRLVQCRGRLDIEATKVLRQCEREQSGKHPPESFPEVWLVDAFVSPMLYCDTASWFWRRSRLADNPIIVFPRTLWNQMGPESRVVLLKHELAHWSRRDQRVRLIEVVAMVLLWWHPLVWIARRQIESCEERCCDAAATTGLPGQRRVYAEAILHTLDFLSEPLERNRSEVEARPLASGLSRLPIVKHRLQKIMRPMGLAGKNFHRTFITLASCAAACILLIWPISPAVSIQYSDPELTTVFADRPLGVKSTVEMEISRRVEK